LKLTSFLNPCGGKVLQLIRGEERDFRQEIPCPLSAEKCGQLEEMIGKGKRSAQLLTNAPICRRAAATGDLITRAD
jgi:hypothetical protein